MSRHEDEHLRRFLAARDQGDAIQMRRWWDEIVIDFYDRMDGLVGAAHRGRLDDDEHELAVSLALTRFATNLIHTFAGVSMGQLVNASKTMARGICIDVQRQSIQDHRLYGRSLDAGWEGGADGEKSSPTWEADEAARRFEQEEHRGEIRDFLAWALPQLTADRRAVLERTLHGTPVSEIVAELSMTPDDAYQFRRRGAKDLMKLKEQFDA